MTANQRKPYRWQKETGPRMHGSQPLNKSKVQAPGIARIPTGGFRLFYTAVGPGKPYRSCQGYILSAVSEDGLTFRPEPGIRLQPQPSLPHMSLRLLAPSVTQCADGRWRMYFEARGKADQPTVICSAISDDMLDWNFEEGIRLQIRGNVRAPRYLPLTDGRARLYCCCAEFSSGEPTNGQPIAQGVISALTSDGLNFELEPGYRLRPSDENYETGSFSAAEVLAPTTDDDPWIMFYSAWQDVPPGTTVPMHPSQDVNAMENGLSDDFAAASIATDMAGYRSRIFTAYSSDGLVWERGACVIEGSGYDGEELDAVHAEDMSLVEIGNNKYRMYYAACDQNGNWCIASAVTHDP